MLQHKFRKYFGESGRDLDWIRDPFVMNSELLPINMQEKFVDRTLKLKLLEVRWWATKSEYPVVFEMALFTHVCMN